MGAEGAFPLCSRHFDRRGGGGGGQRKKVAHIHAFILGEWKTLFEITRHKSQINKESQNEEFLTLGGLLLFNYDQELLIPQRKGALFIKKKLLFLIKIKGRQIHVVPMHRKCTFYPLRGIVV